jgi:hypothetical protein
MLKHFKIKCDFESDGCQQVLRLEELKIHCEDCEQNSLNTRPMKCFCGQEFTLKQMKEHKESLEFIKKRAQDKKITNRNIFCQFIPFIR